MFRAKPETRSDFSNLIDSINQKLPKLVIFITMEQRERNVGTGATKMTGKKFKRGIILTNATEARRESYSK